MLKKEKKKWWLLPISVLLIWVFLHTQNNTITTSEYVIASEKIPASFDGYRILQLSDLHNHSFSKEQTQLIKKAQQTNPDIIVVTGDLVDARRYDAKPSLIAIKQLVEIAPVYYVTGNHEWQTGHFPAFGQALIETGVTVLRDATVQLNREEDTILLHGVDDPLVDTTLPPEEVLTNALQHVASDTLYQILLAHRPEHFALYTEYDFDVVFSGHAHGGQVRLPFIGGLFAPSQGFLPKITEGVHKKNNTSLVVSRGLGNSLFPFRLFNLPELVVVTLKKES